MIKKNILLLTRNYPFGHHESFLQHELGVLTEHFDTIDILPLDSLGLKQHRKLPENIKLIQPLWGKLSMAKLIFHGVFNLSSLRPYQTEFIKVIKSFSFLNLRYFIFASLICRALLSNKKYIQLLSNKATSYDIFYFYWGTTFAFTLPFALYKSTTVMRLHRYDVFEYVTNNYIPFRDKQIKSANKIVHISTAGNEYLKHKYPNIDQSHSSISRLGCRQAPTAQASTDSTLRIVSCSTMFKVKRVELIIEALMSIQKNVCWTHIGSGPLENKLKSLASNLPANIAYHFTGQLNHGQVYEFYKSQRVDVFLNFSSSEGIPVSIMEALSASIPVLATDVGGVSEIVNDGLNGWLLPPASSPTDLAKKIIEISNVPKSKMLIFKKNAFKSWGDNYDAQKNYTHFAEFLKSLSLSN